MKNRDIGHGLVVGIFDDCYHLACDFILKNQFKHVLKEDNTVARELGKMVRDSS